jgi:hypothetical protein
MFIIFNNVCISCNDYDVSNGNHSDEGIIENVLDNTFVLWNASQNEVNEQMNGYVLVGFDTDLSQYTNQAGNIKLSCSFVNDSLQAIVAIVPKSTNIILSSFLKEYEYLGELSSKDVYYNTSKNTMCLSYEILSDDTEYLIMGFTPITSNLFDGDIIIK